MSKRRFLSIVLMTVALLLVTMGVVNATLQTTNVLRAWDDKTKQYENGMMTMWLNNEPETFYTKIDFDSNLHPGACGPNTDSRWAGDATVGLYHTDNDPAGAPGFVKSANWKIVKCSAFGPTGNIKYPAAADILAECVTGLPEDGPCVLFDNPPPNNIETAGCGGNCQDEVVTRFHVNIDAGDGVDPNTKCDETVDAPFVGLWSSNPQNNNLCIYWEAQKPPPVTPKWKGNIQARFGDGQGGDKTINFGDLLGPNAVSMSSLGAVAEANSGTLAAWAGAMLLAAAALYLWRRRTSV